MELLIVIGFLFMLICFIVGIFGWCSIFKGLSGGIDEAKRIHKEKANKELAEILKKTNWKI